MYEITTSCKKIPLLYLFWFNFLFIFPLLIYANDGELFVRKNPTKCLTDYPEVIPRIYPSILQEKVSLIIDVSPRITHQLATHLFVIFLDEVLGYERLEIVEYDDEFQYHFAIERLAAVSVDHALSRSFINLEVWLPPNVDTVGIENLHYVKDDGNSMPPGRFGWFIPEELAKPIQKFYRKWYNDIKEVHWSFLRDRTIVGSFDFDNNHFMNILQTYSKDSHNKFFCPEDVCIQGMYIPPQCLNNQPCAMVLTSKFNETSFVIDHIEKMNLLAKVVWLGPNLNHVYKLLLHYYKQENNPNKSLLVVYYYPSNVFLRQTNLVSVFFKSCQLMNSTSTIGCKYELNRLAKFSWSKLYKMEKQLEEAVRNFHLDEEEFEYLIRIYEENHENLTYREMACQWMQQHQQTWKLWKSGSDRTLIIGGIFPLTFHSFHGAAIVRGAFLAKDIINNDPSILPDYKLNIIVSNGSCQADKVMKSFINYIVDNNYKQLLGILGPACSETVEPIAGVSKHFKVLVISYSAEGASFADRDKYPYFFRTIGENNHYMHVYLNLFKRLNWTRYAALTEDGQRYTEYIANMHGMLEENSINLITNTKFVRSDIKRSMKRCLEDLKRKRARIIIVDVYDHILRIAMCEAYKMKMTPAEGYVWFLPNWLNITWYDVDLYNRELNENVNCTTTQILQVIMGYFTMTHAYFAPNETRIVGNLTVAEWRRLYLEKTLKAGKKDMSNYAGFAYDAVWVYALAMDKLAKTDPEAASDIHATNSTDKLVKIVEDTDFMGVSGHIKFRGGPSRFSVIHLMQWYDNKTNLIGEWHPNLTDNKPTIIGGNLTLNQSAIRWFTRNGYRPSDGGLPPNICTLHSLSEFFNVDCEKAFIILDIMIGILLLTVVILSIYLIKRRYDKKVQTTRDFLRQLGIDFNPSTNLDRWEIPRELVVINRKLGEGAFGTVYGGEANLQEKGGWQAVAVKTLKPGSSCDDKLSFLSEAEVMKRFEHDNIVRLLGVCTKEEPVYTIMEFMLYGDLKTYLLARRHLVNQNDVDNEVSSQRLTSMALDVARALSYLASLKFVHRDIACRNCLVNAQRVVKLGDFGMTRAMFDNNYYKFTRKGMLPVRWMAPESLQEGKFSPATDVWSFGVLLYEIITFGSFPFHGLNNHQVLERVKNGETLSVPDGIHPRLADILGSCWNRNPEERLKAADIVERLADNPRLLTPCLEVSRTHPQYDDNGKIEMRIPKDATALRSASIPNGFNQPLPSSIQPHFLPETEDNPAQPLLISGSMSQPALLLASTSAADMGRYTDMSGPSASKTVAQPLRRRRNDDDDNKGGYTESKV